MSRPRYKWWGYVKGMIREYPELKARDAELRRSSMVADYSGLPHGGGVGRPVEGVSLSELPPTSQREFEAVQRAVAATERYSNGRARLEVIRMVLWDRSHTLEGAALMVPCDVKTAKRWHGDFVRLVAVNFGLLETRKNVPLEP